MSLRRIFLSALVSIMVLAAVPAHARYGVVKVNTWARAGDRIVGHRSDAGRLGVRVPVGSAQRVVWSVENLGGEPALHRVTFSGCAGSNGFGLRYVTRSGKDVTDAVTRAGYTVRHVNAQDRSWLLVRVASFRSDRDFVCDLVGVGMHDTDVVHLVLHS